MPLETSQVNAPNHAPTNTKSILYKVTKNNNPAPLIISPLLGERRQSCELKTNTGKGTATHTATGSL